MPVLINAFGSGRRMAWALGVDDLDELADAAGSACSSPQLPQGLGAMLEQGGRAVGRAAQRGSGTPAW